MLHSPLCAGCTLLPVLALEVAGVMGISVTADCQYLVGGKRSLHCTFLCVPSMVGIDFIRFSDVAGGLYDTGN
jgi:hypothetical protein